MIKDVDFWKGKKVFITGHTGFKGAWLSYVLKLLGAKVYGYSLKPKSRYSFFELLIMNKGYFEKNIYANILELKKIKKEIRKAKPDIVFHLAAQALVRKSYKNPLETYNVNYIGSLNLMHACLNQKSIKSIVLVTSDKVYEVNKKKVFKETDRLGGLDPYSASKASAEIAISSFASSFFDLKKVGIATVRAGNVIGGGDWGEDRLIPDIIKSCKNNKFMLVRYPNAIRPWQHVLEAIFCYLDIARYMYLNKMNKLMTWNVGVNEHHWTVIKIIKLFQSQFLNFSYKIAEDKKFLETKILQLSNKKFSQMFKWRPILNMSQTINFTIEWYKILVDSKIPNLKQITNSQIKFFLDARSKRY